MKFKKDEMIRLSPRVVVDYLQRHGWRHDRDVEGKGAIWLYRDDEGDEYEIMLPINRELGDFAIRMSEAISTLGVVEERDPREVYSTLAETNALPSEVLEGEIAAEEGLEWNAAEKAKMEKLMEALNERVIDGVRHATFLILTEVAETLTRGTALIGDQTSKESAVWRSCVRVLLAAGWSLKDNVSETKFWKALRKGQAETWFDENFRAKPETPVPHHRVSRRG